TTAEEMEGPQYLTPFQRNDIDGRTREHTVQIDYMNPFGGTTHLLETGGKAVWRRNSSLSSLFGGSSESTATESETDRSDLTQKQDIYALYASYMAHLNNWNLTAGLRYEHTDMGIDFHWGDLKNFMTALNDVVPNAAVSYNFSNSSNLRIAYQMRITRPSLNSVNPYQLTITPNKVEMGNPDLSSEKSNKVSITYSNFGRVIGGNIGAEYSAVNNAISNYTYYDNGIQYSTYANIGHERRFALTGYLAWTIIPRMQLSVNARLTHANLKSYYPELENSGWNLNYGANWNYSLDSGFKFDVYGGQETRNHMLQGYNNGWYYYGLGISKSFLKNDALTLNLSASSFLQSKSTYRYVTEFDGIKTTQDWSNYNWNVGLTVSWNFGSLQGGVKQASKSISNDDQTTVGNKSGTSL
ncbi:MAG: outer membrane beta-barrel family protein, partial [Muribaculaceae bacterium]|nr:outer membrane beta-barrel family protein [Muribaculaceae bacterium]